MIWIGIDPGVHTGIAIWDSEKEEFYELCTLPIHKAIIKVDNWWYDCKTMGTQMQLVFEDARQRKWYTGNSDAKKQGAGSVKRDCTIWEDFCKDMGIPLQAVPPTKGMTKWTPEYFRMVIGWTGRTSEHARDAAMLVFGR